MSPTTHLLASWIVAAKTTNNPRDCALVTWAGVLPDLDGLGLVTDLFNQAVFNRHTEYYQQYHHYLTHGLLGAVIIVGVLTCFARQRLRVAILALLTFHLHLLCDFVGSRGPEMNDKWPIFYLAPFRLRPMWVCHWQWRLDGWQNLVISLVLFIWAMSMALKRGDSFISVFSRKADAVFMTTVTRWWNLLRALMRSRADS